jgi:signal transduction histidine kinase
MMEQLAIIFAVSSLVISLLVIAVLKLKKRTAALQSQLTCIQQECNELKNKITQFGQERDGLLTQLTRDAVQFYEDELQFMGAEIHDDLIQRLMEHRLMMEKLGLTEDITELQAIGLKLKSQFEEVRRAVRRVSK